jgi:hypothetical protein
MNDPVQSYISAHSKSQISGFLLTLLFGPLGLFYSSWVAALILCVIAIVTAVSIIGPIICWMLAILISFATVSGHNKKVHATANLNQSISQP